MQVLIRWKSRNWHRRKKLVATGQESASTAIGSGTISIDFGTISGGTLSEDGYYTDASFESNGEGVHTITIDSTNNTLTGIRDAINEAGIGVTASIINDGSDTPYRLALTVDNTGEEYSMQISVDGDAALESLLGYDPTDTQNLSQTSEAQNAEFTVDGIAISKASNTVSDVITGVNLSLLATNIDEATTITISRDTSSISSAVESFVEAYNEVITAVQELTVYDADSEEAGLLNGDSATRNIQMQIRRILSEPVSGGSGSLTRLSQVGVTIQDDGLLEIDDDTLSEALSENFDSFAGLFASGGSVTDSTLTYSTASSNTVAGTYDVVITQLATQGTLVGSAAAGLTIDSSNDTIEISVDGVVEEITLTQGTYASYDELASEIQSQINGNTDFSDSGITVNVSADVGGVLTITSASYGADSIVEITGGNGYDNLGLGEDATTTYGLDVAGTIGGSAATGSGQTLTATSGDANGISIIVNGGNTGSRGTVSFSQGYAYQFDELLSSYLDEDDGIIAKRIDGLNESIDGLAEEEDRINARLEVIEARYRTQFTALEVLLSELQTTSDYLTQQLEALADLRSQS